MEEKIQRIARSLALRRVFVALMFGVYLLDLGHHLSHPAPVAGHASSLAAASNPALSPVREEAGDPSSSGEQGRCSCACHHQHFASLVEAVPVGAAHEIATLPDWIPTTAASYCPRTPEQGRAPPLA